MSTPNYNLTTRLMRGKREALFVFDFIGLVYFDKIIIYICYF